jgi:hypothetical protein
MKNFKIPYLMIVLLLTIGCSNDDDGFDNLSSTEQLILGNWTVTHMSISGNMTAIDSDYDYWWVFRYYPIPVQAFIENQDYSVNFSKSKELTSNGNLKTSYVAFVDDYETAFEYSKVIEKIDAIENGEWTMDDIFLTVTSNGLIEKYPIIELTSNKLTILKHLKDDVLLNLTYGDVNCITNLEVYLTFERN